MSVMDEDWLSIDVHEGWEEYMRERTAVNREEIVRALLEEMSRFEFSPPVERSDG